LDGVDIDMDALVRDVFREVTEGLPTIPAFSRAILPRAHGDPVLVHQVVWNLLSNAVKYCRGKGEAVVSVVGERRGIFVEYRVRDNGAGFDGSKAGKLFGLFQRLHKREEYEGSGVGLSLVRRIVERHGGAVRARGETGRGAEFVFTLPAADADIVSP
jgi:signal transduction histidine kinase